MTRQWKCIGLHAVRIGLVYLALMATLFVAPAIAQTTIYDEAISGDLNATPGTPVFDLVEGVNIFKGSIEATAPSQQDSWAVNLASGYVITSLTYSGPTDNGGASFAGFFEYTLGGENNNSRSGSLSATFVPGLTSGGMLRIATDFNISPKNWNVQITVVCPNPNGCAPQNQPPIANAGPD